MLGMLFTEILYRPIFNILAIFLAIFGGNLGVAIILLTITIRLLMIKQSTAGNDMQKGMGALQPKLNEIQEKYKDDPKKLSEETMKVFKTDGKGALTGCLQMLIQIPVFIGLYYVIRHMAAATIPQERLYSFFNSFGARFVESDALTSGVINTNFFGIDLLGTKNIVLAIIAGVFTFLQTKLTTLAKPATPTIPGQKTPDMGKMMGFMNYFLVIMIGSFVYSMQTGVGLYIVTTTIFSVAQYSRQYKALLKAKRGERTSRGKGIIINPK
ncbi:MAG: YidC/Oxa1 family membrane protein insertase [Candidatus Absconditabacterales bacterium]